MSIVIIVGFSSDALTLTDCPNITDFHVLSAYEYSVLSLTETLIVVLNTLPSTLAEIFISYVPTVSLSYDEASTFGLATVFVFPLSYTAATSIPVLSNAVPLT